ncbi:MAG: M10 family metallopeptidase [Planctomycetota bacterium]
MASPVVETNNPTVFVNGLINAIDLFSASDPDDAITSYTFWDFRGTANTGLFVFDGVPFSNGATFTIDAADIGKLKYSGGSQVGYEGFRVVARDEVGNFSTPAIGRIYSVRSNTTAPNVAKPDFSILANEVVPARSFVRGFDPDGYPLTHFEFSDLNSVSTIFSVNERIWVGSYQHNFETGDQVTISGADQSQFNISAPITVTNDNVFYIDAPGMIPLSATGDIKAYVPDLGHFELNGTAMPQGQPFVVTEAELDDLYYVATGPNAQENVYLRGYDGVKWSLEKRGEADIKVNANRPTVQFSRSITPADQLHDFWQFLNVTDADMNTAKTFEFYNTSPHAQNGDLVFQGQVVPRKTWVSVPADEIDQLQFITPRQGFEQLIRVRVYDGKHWSGAGTHTIESLPPIIRPEVVPLVDVIVDEQRSDVAVANFFTKTDPGNAHTSVQIYEPTTSPESGHFLFGVTPLPGDQVHEFSPGIFNAAISFRTGDYQNRHVDTFYQRNFNGNDWSKWHKVEIRTEPEINDALESGATWTGLLGFNAFGQLRIPYSFMQSFPEYETGEAVDDPPNGRPFERFDDTQRANTRIAFDQLEQFLNVDFVEVPDSQINEFGGQGGIIRFGEYGIPFPDSTAAAFAFLPGFGDAPGDIWINRELVAGGRAAPLNQDTDGYVTLIHEIGHALGLKHPFQGSPRLPMSTDSNDYTVMSYTGADLGFPATFQPYDVVELQQLYGANLNHATGDDLYAIGNYFNRLAFVETIWDAGGNDTLSAEGSPVNSVVDLRAGERSSIGFIPRNVTIAYDVVMENAVGSDNDDELIGNFADNMLVGGNGNDRLMGHQGNDDLTGGAGDDVFVWGVADGDDRINEQGFGGRDRIEIPNVLGVDSLTEDLEFRMSGNDLFVDMKIDGGSLEGSISVSQQTLNGYRVESLTIGGQTIDLVNLTSQLAPGVEKFATTGSSSAFGLLVAPV